MIEKMNYKLSIKEKKEIKCTMNISLLYNMLVWELTIIYIHNLCIQFYILVMLIYMYLM